MGRLRLNSPYAQAIIASLDVVLLLAVLWLVSHQAAELILFALIPTGAIICAYLFGRIHMLTETRRAALAEMEEKLARHERSLRRSVEELSLLHEISLAASAATGVDEVLRNTTAAMQKHLPYPSLSFFLLDDQTGSLEVRTGYGDGFEDAQHAEMHVGVGVTGAVAASGEPILAADVLVDQRYVNYTASTRSQLCVPMKVGSRVIGGIDVQSPVVGAFGDDDRRFLITIGSQLAMILEHARLLDEARRRGEMLAALHTASQAMIAQLDKNELLNAMVEVASQVFAAPAAAVYLSQEGDDMAVQAAWGVSDAYRAQQRIPAECVRTLIDYSRGLPATLNQQTMQAACLYPNLVPAERLTGTLFIPLQSGQRVLGALVVFSNGRHGSFTSQDTELAQILAGQAVIGLENARLFTEASKAREMVALQRIAATMSSSLNLTEVLGTIVSVTAEVMRSQKAAIFDLDDADRTLNLLVSHGLSDGFREGSRLLPVAPGERGAAGLGEPVVVPDVETAPRPYDFVALARSEGFRSFIEAPMRSKGKVIGVISVYYTDAHAFSAAEVDLLSTLASQAAVALDNARLYGQTDTDLRRRVDELTSLQQISLRLVSSLDLTTVLQSIAESTLHLVNATNVHIFLYDEARRVFLFGTALWSPDREPAPVMYPRPNGVTMSAIRERRPIVIQDAASHPLFSGSETSGYGVKAIASFPLLRAQTPIGAFNVAFLEPHTFTDDELRVLKLLADQAAIAVDNATLHERLADQAQRDSLTQVYNHGHLLELLDTAVQEHRAHGTPLSFIMIDVDHFKEYNDAHGHLMGDKVLHGIVQTIQSNVKNSDTVGRWGGEEFGIILRGANTRQALKVAERIRFTLRALRFRDGKGKQVEKPTVSQGIASIPDQATTAEALVDRADRALYQAKARGRDQVVAAE